MKKIILLITLFFVSIGASAQNANRSGFFMELASGVYSGPSYYKVQWNPEQLKIQPLYGIAVNIALGYRFKLSRSFALDARIQAQSLICEKMEHISVGPVIAARYTSPEIFKNVSLYASAGTGYYLYTWLPDKSYDIAITTESGLEYYYAKAQDGRMLITTNLGMNFTTHFYGGVVCDMMLGFSPTRFRNLLGVQLGYRF